MLYRRMKRRGSTSPNPGLLLLPVTVAGYTACAVDVRGYIGFDNPHEVEAYSLERLSGDVAGLIGALSPDQPAGS